MTVRDLIGGAFRLLGVIAQGEQPTAEEAQDALASLNDMVDSWKLERLMVYTIAGQEFPLIAGRKAYTLGPGGDFNTERPVRIDKVSLKYSTGARPIIMPIDLINLDQYQAESIPDTTSTFPTEVYDDGSFPLRQLFFYPVPSQGSIVEIFSWGLVDGFASINDEINLPPGYQRALRFNLAIELAPEYGKSISAEVADRAAEAKAAIKSANIEPLYMRADDALLARNGGAFNWRTGN